MEVVVRLAEVTHPVLQLLIGGLQLPVEIAHAGVNVLDGNSLARGSASAVYVAHPPLAKQYEQAARLGFRLRKRVHDHRDWTKGGVLVPDLRVDSRLLAVGSGGIEPSLEGGVQLRPDHTQDRVRHHAGRLLQIRCGASAEIDDFEVLVHHHAGRRELIEDPAVREMRDADDGPDGGRRLPFQSSAVVVVSEADVEWQVRQRHVPG